MSGEPDNEKATCRFCLQSRNTKSNPLITPCECKGSLRYVHIRCLNKWMLFHPNRHATHCELCLTRFFLVEHPALEIYPASKTYAALFLRYPFLLSVILHYAWLIHGNILDVALRRHDVDPSLYIGYQWIFQVIYFTLFFSQWRVRNRRLYFEEMKNIYTLVLLLVYTSLVSTLHAQIPIAGPIMNVYVGAFWQWHLSVLGFVNDRLLHAD